MARWKVIYQVKYLMRLIDYNEWFLCCNEEKYSTYVVAILPQFFVVFSSNIHGYEWWNILESLRGEKCDSILETDELQIFKVLWTSI